MKKAKTIKTPHDRFFRSAMSDLRVAKEFMQAYLPLAIQRIVDLDTLTLMHNTYVDKALKLVMSDVVYRVALITGETAYIYALCEHQSSSDPWMPFRIWQYVINIWSDHIKQYKLPGHKLPLVVPLVFYSGEEPYTGSNDICDLIDAPRPAIEQALFEKTFQLIDLTQMEDDELGQKKWAGMMGLMMKHIRDRDFLHFLRQIMTELRDLEAADGTDYLILLLNYCLNSVEPFDIEEFVQAIRSGLTPEIGEKIMTMAENLRAEGKAEGKAEGETEALEKIALRALCKGISLKDIKELTGLSAEMIQAIKNKNAH